MEHKKIVERIRNTRLANGITQEHLSNKLKRNSDFIYKLESGRIKITLEMCVEICKLLDVSLDYIAQDVVPAAYQNVAEQRLREYLSQLNKKQTEYVLNEIENFIKFVNDK